MTIPSNIPPGNYYVGAMVTINGFGNDDLTWNNRTYFASRINITCSGVFSLSPDSRTFGAGGGTGSVSVNSVASACPYFASSSASWLTITSGGSGTGNATISYTVAANTGAARSALISAGGDTHLVTQPGGCLVTTAPLLSWPTTVNATLTTGDCLSRLRLLGGLYRPYADRYTFTAQAGQQIAIALESASFDTYLYLIGPNGAVTAQDDDSGVGTNSRIPASGFLILPSTGTYTIEVTSYRESATGGYRLTLSRP